MSTNTLPLSGSALTPISRSSLNSQLTSLVLDSDVGVSSVLVTTGGQKSMYIDPYSNIAINHSSPTAQLDINSANGSCLLLRYNGTSNVATMYLSSSGQLTLGSSGNEINTSSNFNIKSHNGASAGLFLNNTLVTSTATQLNYVNVTAGQATASKALILDSAKSITGITTLEASTLGGTLSTPAQPAITSVGTLTGLSVNGNLSITGTLVVAGSTFSTTSIGYISGVTPGTATASKALILDASSNITGIGSIGATTILGAIGTATQTGITSVGTLTSLAVSGGVLLNSTTDSTSSSTGSVIVAGGVGIAKTLYVGTGIYGSISTPSQSLITSLGTLTGLNVSGSISSTSTTDSSSTSTGAIITAGGVGIAKNLYVGGNTIISGNLTVSGTTTTVYSSSMSVSDNTLILNSGPSGSGKDSGIMIHRYQTDNNSGTGDVVSDTEKLSTTVTAATATTVTLQTGVNTNNDFYKNWWIKITSGSAANNVRQITSYDGTTRVATLSSAMTATPANGTSINLYNKPFTTFIWQESSKSFMPAFVASDSTSTMDIIDKANMSVNKLTIIDSTASSSSSTGSIITQGGVAISNATDASSSTNGGALTVAGGGSFAKSVYIGTTLSIGGSSVDSTRASYLSGVTAGTAASNKALVLGSSGEIATITSLTATSIYGAIATPAQTGITSVGTLTGLTVSGTTNITSNASSTSATTGALIITGGVGIGGAVNVTGNITSSGTVTGGSLSGTIITPTQTSITSLGTLTGLTVSGTTSITANTSTTSTTSGALVVTGGVGIGGSISLGGSISIGGNSIGSDQAGYLSGITPGTASNSKALVMSSTGTISGISSLSSSAIVLNGSDLSTTLNTINTTIAPLQTITAGTATANKALVLNGTKDVSGINSLSVATIILNGTNIQTALDNATAIQLQGVTEGTVTASKAVVVDANRDISTFRNLTATNISGTIQTAAQPSITSLGTLTGLAVSGSANGIVITNTTASSTANIQFTNDNRSYELGLRGSTNASGAVNGLYVYDVSATTMRLVLDSSGNMGINTSVPGYRLDVNGSHNASSYYLSGVLVPISALSGITLGTAAASKVLSLDASSNVSGINALTSTYLYGAIQTASQTAITSLGTLTGLVSSGAVSLTLGTDATSTTSGGTLTVTGGAAISAKLYVGGGIYGAIQTAAQTNITSLGTLTGITSSGAVSLTLGTDATSTTSGGTLTVTGGAAISAKMYVGGGIYGTLQTGSQTNITSIGTLTGLTSSGAVSLTLGTDATSTTAGGTLTVTGGAAVSAKMYVGGGIYGTLQTASQTNITSLGTLTGLSVSGSTTGLATITNTSTSSTSSLTLNAATGSVYEIGSRGSANATLASSFYVYDTTNTSYRLVLSSSGNFGIGLGTTAPSYILDVGGTINSNTLIRSTRTTTGDTIMSVCGTSTFKVNHTLNGIATIGTSTANDLAIQTNGTNRFYIQSSGNVGLNNSSPGYNLDITGTLNASNTINTTLTASGNSYYSSCGGSTFGMYHTSAGSMSIGTISANDLDFKSTNISRLSVLSDGRIMVKGSSGGSTAYTDFDVTVSKNVSIGSLSTNSYTGIDSFTNLKLVANTKNNTFTAASGTDSIMKSLMSIYPPTLTATNTSVTTTNASTLYITGAPIASTNMTITNSWGLYVDGASARIVGDLVLGGSASENLLRFTGVTGDLSTNHTVIAERLYSGSDKSELYLFKGNDVSTSAGPDRIRLRAAEIRFQTFATNELYSDYLDSNDRMTISSDGYVGIGNASPSYALDMGATARDRILSLFSISGSDFYGFGANSSRTYYFTKTAHYFYTQATTASLGNIALQLGSSTATFTGDLTAPSLRANSGMSTTDTVSGVKYGSFTVSGSSTNYLKKTVTHSLAITATTYRFICWPVKSSTNNDCFGWTIDSKDANNVYLTISRIDNISSWANSYTWEYIIFALDA